MNYKHDGAGIDCLWFQLINVQRGQASKFSETQEEGGQRQKNKRMFYFNLSQVLLNRLRTLEWREKENSLRSLDDFQPNMTDERQLLQVLESIKMTTMKCTCDRERL